MRRSGCASVQRATGRLPVAFWLVAGAARMLYTRRFPADAEGQYERSLRQKYEGQFGERDLRGILDADNGSPI